MCLFETKRVRHLDRNWNEPARPVSYYSERPDGYDTRVATLPAAAFRGRRSSSSSSSFRGRDDGDEYGRRRAGGRRRIW
jgi:hypothetical protein